MNFYNELIKKKNIYQIFVFGMYRSGTTVIARSLAGKKNFAFASDPIRPFFNHYRTKLQKKIKFNDIQESSRPLGDYFNSHSKYIEHLMQSDFSEKISKIELREIRSDVIKQGEIYSPKFIKNLKKNMNFKSLNFSEELKFYLAMIISTYGNKKTSLVGLKEVWSIEMALPILNFLGKMAKIIVIIRDPLDIITSSVGGSANYSILSLARQWRKQVVFYKLLKKLYPNSVQLINYEDFCETPEFTLKHVFQNFMTKPIEFSSSKLKPIDDNGNLWIKNSSYLKKKSSNIDKSSIGNYKKNLNNSEIEWIIYLTHMCSYKRYNHYNHVPKIPISDFPKRNINNVQEWAKFDMINLEQKNLKKELEIEHNRVKKMKLYDENREKSLKLIIDQL